MFKKAKYFLAATALLGLAISGCGSKTDGTVANPNPSPFQPKGTVAGVLTNSVTNEPIANATIYIADKSAVTNAGGSFSIANVSANLATGNEPTNTVPATDPYQVVIDMSAVNSTIKAYNDNAANTTKKPYYPSFAYTTATVKYDSLGDAAGAIAPVGSTAGTTSTNHDTPVDGFVASIAPKVGPLSANVKIQVVNSSTLANISGATVELISQGSGYLANTPTGSAITATTGHIVATGTTDTSGLVTFSSVEAGTTFLARATSSDSTLSGYTSDANNTGAANLGPASITTEGDNVTVSYLLNQAKNALMVATVESQAPVILTATPELNSDLTVPTTGGQDVVFTFSKAIKADSYATATDASKAAVAGLYKDISVTFDGSKAGNIAYTLTWSTDMKTLTVNLPSLSPSSKYTVSLAATTLVDSLAQAVTNKATNGKGIVMFTTNGGATAAAPTVVVVNSATIDSTSSVNLDWNPASGAKKYNVYRSLIENWGTTTTAAPYRLIGTGVVASDYVDDFATGTNSIALDTANGTLANFVENGHVKLTYSYIVKSVNSDLTEGASSTAVTAADVIGPVITAPAPTLTANPTTLTLTFGENLDEVTAETAANYVWKDSAARDTQTTPAAISITGAVYNPAAKTVALTLSGTLNTSTLTRTYFINPTGTGATGLTPNLIGVTDDTQSVVAGQGVPLSACVTEDGAILTAQTTALAGTDDVQVIGVGAATTAGAVIINSGVNGICQTTRAGTETQTLTVGQGQPNQPVTIGAGPDLILQTAAGANAVVRANAIQASGVKDVAGNTIRTTGDVVDTDGTIE